MVHQEPVARGERWRAGVAAPHRHVRSEAVADVAGVGQVDPGAPPFTAGDRLLVDHVALLRRGDGTVVVARTPLDGPRP